MQSQDEYLNVSKGVATFSKKRYKLIEIGLNNLGLTDDAIQNILKLICHTLNFDPNAKATTERDNQRVLQYIKKKAAESGLSTYQLYQKECYERNKERSIKDIRECKSKKTLKPI